MPRVCMLETLHRLSLQEVFAILHGFISDPGRTFWRFQERDFTVFVQLHNDDLVTRIAEGIDIKNLDAIRPILEEDPNLIQDQLGGVVRFLI